MTVRLEPPGATVRWRTRGVHEYGTELPGVAIAEFGRRSGFVRPRTVIVART